MSKVKKPIYKKWWFWVIIAVVVISIATGGGGDKEDTTDDTASAQEDVVQNDDKTESEPKEKATEKPTAEPTKEPTPKPTEEPTPEPIGLESGMYKVGEEIDAGEYLVISEEGLFNIGYLEVTKDSSGEFESIICNETFNTFVFITVEDGQYFKFQDSRAVPVSEAVLPVQEDGQYGEGMYRVGIDIPAGEYILTSEDGTFGGIYYFEVNKDSKGVFDGIISNGTFSTFVYITIDEGQYFKCQNSIAKPVTDSVITGAVDGQYGSGMYRVGIDIPAGEYKVFPNDDSSAYYEVCKNSYHDFKSIVTNELFEAPVYLTVKDGQYLILTDCYIEE